MVDSAATGTSRSVPHWKQVILRFSTAAFFGATGAASFVGCFISSRRKCARHALQIVEYAPTGSRCEWPHLGHVTVVVFGLAAAIQEDMRLEAKETAPSDGHLNHKIPKFPPSLVEVGASLDAGCWSLEFLKGAKDTPESFWSVPRPVKSQKAVRAGQLLPALLQAPCRGRRHRRLAEQSSERFCSD